MPLILHEEEIIDLVSRLNTVEAIEKGFVAYSNHKTVVPPVAELLFEAPKGETHIKYGYIKNQAYSVIKVASGFYGNRALGLSSSQGLMLLFSQKTGQTQGVLLDNGYLTDIRTAAAGAVVAKYFAPKHIKGIGIVGSGIQSRLQLQYLQRYTPCKTVWVWSRNAENAQKFKEDLGGDFDIHIAKNPSQLAGNCNLIVTTTPSEKPLLKVVDIQPGTHITAVGSDTANKQELASDILQKADLVIADSLAQSTARGEIYKAQKADLLSPESVIELGAAIQNPDLQRTNEHQISVADLTGVAVQDIMIATAVYEAKLTENKLNKT
jgi:ornithine cyclodeaminase